MAIDALGLVAIGGAALMTALSRDMRQALQLARTIQS